MNTKTKIMLLGLVVALCACQSRELGTQTSYLTGWKNFDPNTTNFEAYEGNMTVAPTGMLAIPGGSFIIGQMDEFITAPRNSERRTLTVSPFYMDKYEVTNLGWREYVEWTNYVFGSYNQEIVNATLPDTAIWREEMAYNEPYVYNYFRHPAYSFYPVVGVSWDQAMAYCQWRTDRVNERALVAGKYIEQLPYNMVGTNNYMSEQEVDDFLKQNKKHPEYAKYEKQAVELPLSVAKKYGYQGSEMPNADGTEPMVTMYRLPYEWVRDQFVFNTEKYMNTAYNPTIGKGARKDAYGHDRKINNADGILVVGYRLPTEAEWEYAAFAPVADPETNGGPLDGKIYPWSGLHPRDLNDKKTKGQMMANFVRGRGDMMGIAGAPNDGYVITAPVDAFAANDFGLYNMAGNVNEWVLDVYRETTYSVMAEYNPYRGNVYSRLQLDAEGKPIVTATGALAIEYEPEDDKRNYKDGDLTTRLDTDYPLDTLGLTAEQMAEVKYDPTDVLAPHITENTRVYKGGSWNDRIYWLNPTTRRFMDQSKASSTIGFRCAMTILGDDAM